MKLNKTVQILDPPQLFLINLILIENLSVNPFECFSLNVLMAIKRSSLESLLNMFELVMHFDFCEICA